MSWADDDGRASLTDRSGAGGGVRRFAAEEMVACEACSRSNPPTRMHCLYCGAALPAAGRGAEHLRPTLRRLEEWEGGHNVILGAAPARPLAPEAAAECAAFLKLETEQLSALLAFGAALPLARAASTEEARLIAGRLAAHGLRTFVLGDAELRTDEPPRRARSFGLTGDALTVHFGAGGEHAGWAWADVSLLVAGRLVSRRVEVEERQSRFGSRGEVVDARELAADEAVLDIYPRAGGTGLRVLASGFDYSCLGAGKGLVAGENFAALVRALRERAPHAEFDEGYARARHLLSIAWPPSERNESGGLRRDRPGRFNTEAVTVVSNEAQFTRYSRLRHYLAQRGRTRAT
ncbi:MAG TPA: hypothetical protein VEY09_10175 [Pyrinomonadaceae bacterium]|nr:hypothetical protein [Pyrinomonadaceae bacterium]